MIFECVSYTDKADSDIDIMIFQDFHDDPRLSLPCLTCCLLFKAGWRELLSVTSTSGVLTLASKLGQILPKLGQIWDFLRSVSVHFGSVTDLKK